MKPPVDGEVAGFDEIGTSSAPTQMAPGALPGLIEADQISVPGKSIRRIAPAITGASAANPSMPATASGRAVQRPDGHGYTSRRRLRRRRGRRDRDMANVAGGSTTDGVSVRYSGRVFPWLGIELVEIPPRCRASTPNKRQAHRPSLALAGNEPTRMTRSAAGCPTPRPARAPTPAPVATVFRQSRPSRALSPPRLRPGNR